MNKRFATIAFYLVSGMLAAQDCYTIKMSLRTEGLPPEYAAYGEQEITTYIKGDKTKTEVTSMMFTNTMYSDGKTVTSLTDAMGNKSGFTATKEELENEGKADKKEKPKIEYSEEKKMIAGYECTKAIVISVGKDKKENKSIVWVTEKIKFNPQARRGAGRGGMVDLSELKGYPLAMEMSSTNQGQEMKILMTATEVLTGSLEDALFVPETTGFTMMNYKDWMEKQKNMGQR